MTIGWAVLSFDTFLTPCLSKEVAVRIILWTLKITLRLFTQLNQSFLTRPHPHSNKLYELKFAKNTANVTDFYLLVNSFRFARSPLRRLDVNAWWGQSIVVYIGILFVICVWWFRGFFSCISVYSILFFQANFLNSSFLCSPLLFCNHFLFLSIKESHVKNAINQSYKQ